MSIEAVRTDEARPHTDRLRRAALRGARLVRLAGLARAGAGRPHGVRPGTRPRRLTGAPDRISARRRRLDRPPARAPTPRRAHLAPRRAAGSGAARAIRLGP